MSKTAMLNPTILENLKSEVKPIFALAGLTFKEAVRSRIFIFVLIVSILAIIASAGVTSVAQEDTAKLLRQWITTIITSTSIVMSIFLCAFGIPFEKDSKRILVVLSKPISRGGYFISKWLGYVYVISIIFLILSLTGGIVVFLSKANSIAKNVEFFQIRQSFLPKYTSFYGDTIYETSIGSRNDNGIILSDAHQNSVVTTINLDNFDEIRKEQQTFLLDIFARIRVRGNREMAEKNWVLKAKRADEIHADFEIQMPFKDPFRYRIELPKSVFDETGKTLLTMEFKEYPYSVLVMPGSVRILGKQTSFVFSFFKLLLVECGKVFLILSIVVLFSAVFTPYTSILGGLMGWFFFNSSASIPQMLNNLEKQFEFNMQKAAVHGSAISWDTQLSSSVFSTGVSDFLIGLSRLMPDFKKFEIQWNFIEGYDTAFSTAISGFGYYFLWCLALVFLGYLLFKFIDFK